MLVELQKGKHAGLKLQLDEEDLDLLGLTWRPKHGRPPYLVRTLPNPKKDQVLHRVIAERVHGDLAEGTLVDHINGDFYDNRRVNLRLADKYQNIRNQRLRTDNSSGYKGVSFSNREGRWLAQVRYQGKTKFIGYFSDPLQAALAYDRAALEYFGEFARTNASLGLITYSSEVLIQLSM